MPVDVHFDKCVAGCHRRLVRLAARGVNVKKLKSDIPRAADLSREEFVNEYLKPHQPVVLTEATKSWNAIGKWSLDHLAETHRDHTVLVERYPTQSRSNAYTYVEMTVNEYIETVRASEKNRKTYYLADTALETTLPQLTNDVVKPAFIPSDSSVRTGLFLGHDTFSAAHYHRKRCQALLCQITGVKEVLLYPARHTKYLYPHAWYGLRPNFSQIDMEFENRNDSFDEYPDFDKAETYYCELKPGESLFIPDHWMHTVTGLEDNASLTYFWDESISHCFLPGLFRDYAAHVSKSTLITLARASKMVGLHKSMLEVAIQMGIVPRSEEEAVLQHFEEFGGQLPNTVKSSQQA